MNFEIKKMVLISFTDSGDELAYDLEKKLSEDKAYQELHETNGDWNISRNGQILGETQDFQGYQFECKRYCYENYNQHEGIAFKSGRKVMEDIFSECDYIVFIGACGMAVRMIDGLLGGKDRDPGIVVIDTESRFVISLLSGHLGGANELAEYLAESIGAIPVITTATDSGGKFSPDVFAKKNNLYITDLSMAKKVAAGVLNGDVVTIVSDYEMQDIPVAYEEYMVRDMVNGEKLSQDKLSQGKFGSTAIYIGISKNKLIEVKKNYEYVLWLIPKDMMIGVGCRKNTDSEKFEKEILRHLKDNGIDLRRVREIHSVDIKRSESAIQRFSKKYNIPCRFYSAKALGGIEGEFTSSPFVEEITGVDNICERSAVIEGGELTVRKCAGNGITFAAAKLDEWRLVFV